MQKILIADDEAKIRRIIRDFLTAKGFETVEAEDGAQALRVFSENSDIAHPPYQHAGHHPDCARRGVR